MNNPLNMTIVEQLISIREETCKYACMFKEYAEDEFKDDRTRERYLQSHCERCPLGKIHYQVAAIGSNPEQPIGESQTTE